jgi:hypothetical protein
MTPESNPDSRSQGWLARPSFVLASVAIVMVALLPGSKSLTMLAVGLAAAVPLAVPCLGRPAGAAFAAASPA